MNDGSRLYHYIASNINQKALKKNTNYIKLESLCTVKQTINKTKRQPAKWEKIFTKNTSNKGLISNIYRELV